MINTVVAVVAGVAAAIAWYYALQCWLAARRAKAAVRAPQDMGGRR